MAKVKSSKSIKAKFKSGACQQWLGLLAPLLMLSMLFFMRDWLDRQYLASANDLIAPLIISLLNSILISLIFFPSFKKGKLGSLIGASLVMMLLSSNYDQRLASIKSTLTALNPLPIPDNLISLFYHLLFLAIIFLLGLSLAHLINRFVSVRHWPEFTLARGIVITITVIFLLLGISVAKTIVIEWPQFSYRPPTLPTQTKAGALGKPDIYYIVLDRYTSQQVLTSQFNFNNSQFVNFLRQNNFYVDPNAKANYPNTATSIASTVNANYDADLVNRFSHAADQTAVAYYNSFKYASVIQKLKSLGYSYYHLGSWFDLTNEAPLADHLYQPDGQLTIFGHQFTLSGLAKDYLGKSIYAPLLQHSLRIKNLTIIGYSTQDEKDATISKINILNQLSNAPAGGRFIFAHLLVPHDPYYFNADGSLADDTGNDNNGKPIKQKYTGQVEFINSQMTKIISQIEQNSQQKAIIILQSDEGPYPIFLNDEDADGDQINQSVVYGDMTKESDQNLQMKYGVLAAYNIPVASSQELAAYGDNVNIFRLVLDRYFGANLPALPRCYYAFTKGQNKTDLFSDITQRLTGSSNPACAKASNFSQ